VKIPATAKALPAFREQIKVYPLPAAQQLQLQVAWKKLLSIQVLN
jgi:hypothetical protein